MSRLLLLLAAGIVAATAGGPAPAADDFSTLPLPDKAREVLNRHCAECHGPGSSPRAGLNVLEYAHVADYLVKNNSDRSELLQMVEAGMMPPGTRPKVPPEDVAILREWVGGGAAAFHPYASDDYAYGMILRDINALTREDRRAPEKVRYVAFNHLAGKPNALGMPVYRAALTRLLNLLSTGAEVIRPEPIDPVQSIYRVRLDSPGWDVQPYADPRKLGLLADDAPAPPFNVERIRLHDLLLLEYPYASIHDDSELQRQIISSYLAPAGMLRPIAFVRGDWLIATAGGPLLYHDLLQVPGSLALLEGRIGFKGGEPLRAGIVNSREVRNNRILERLSTPDLVYWRTFDMPRGRGADDLLGEADKQFAAGVGGSVVFSLQNGLPGFYLFGGDHKRINEVPESLVNREHLDQKGPITSGINCMQCHRNGLVSEPIADALREAIGASSLPAEKKAELLKRYPGGEKMTALMREDLKRFEDAFARLPDQVPGVEDPISQVISSYLEQLEELTSARADVANLRGRGGVAARGPDPLRDLKKEELMEQAIRKAHQGIPILPLDGLTHPQRNGSVPLKVDFQFQDEKGVARNSFFVGEKVAIVINNRSGHDLYVELYLFGGGAMNKIPIGDVIEVGNEARFPDDFIELKSEGDDQAILYMSDKPFPPGVLLKQRQGAEETGISDRVVHPFYALSPDGSRILPSKDGFDPDRVSKRTIRIITKKRE